jgi:DNA polymerase I
MTQTGFEDFSGAAADGDGGDRPAEEAMAVAGNGGGRVDDVVDAADVRFPEADGHVELLVTQVDYTIEGQGNEEYPVIHVFGRTPENEREHVRVLGVEPYFYVPTADLRDSGTDPVDEYDAVIAARESREGRSFESIRGEPLTKVITRTPRDVGRIRDDFETTFEADILFPNRFLVDTGVRSGVRVPERRLDDEEGPDDASATRGPIQVRHGEVTPTEVDADLRVCTFDIEVDDRRGFPEDGEEPIVCLTSHDSYRDEYVAWLYVAPDGTGAPPETLSTYETLDEDVEVDVRTFVDEDAMLDAFLSYTEEIDVDIFTGWNFEDFDAPYLLDRLEQLNPASSYPLEIERLSRVGEVWRSGWGGPDVKGRVVFDLLYAYKRTQFTELESYRLDAVGELELDVGKERYAGDIGDLWESDPERLLEYNVRDVELCVEIDRKQNVIAFWDEVRQFVGCKLEDAPTPGDTVDMYVLHKAFGNFALPTKGQQESEDFEGGAVFDPITGVRENVSVLDLKCFSGDTDVLTPDGQRNIKDIEVGDRVYTLNPETFECEIQPVAETHEYENAFGELHHLSGDTHDFKITENHRLLASRTGGWDSLGPDDFEFREYREFVDAERYVFPTHEPMAGETPGEFDLLDDVDGGYVVVYTDDDLRRFRHRVPEAVTDSLTLVHGTGASVGVQQKVGKYLVPIDVYREHKGVVDEQADDLYLKYGRQHRETPVSFRMRDWLELIGWYATEGSVDGANGRFTIHQQDDDNRTSIRRLLDRMGIGFNTDDRGINVSDQYLVEWLSDHCGDGYADKRLPDWVSDLDATLLRPLLDVLIEADGSRTHSGLGEFWTKSDQLKDDVVDVAVRCGEKPTVSRQSDGTWCVSIGKGGSFNKSTDAEVETHDGTVYCITAEENHTVLAGRNGHFQWIGQSLYPMCMVTMNASPETKVGDDYDGETYHAPTGTRFRKEPDGMMREMVDELLTEREELKAARNEHEPDSEAYGRYDRQQQAVKVIMNCFTPDTDVLTPDGVQNVRNLSVGDDVYSLNPETMALETKPVVETHEYPDYDGELIDIETDKIDFRVTPNHRMLVRKAETNGIAWDEDDYRFVEAGELDDATNYQLPHDWDGPDGERIDEVDLTEYLDGEFEVWCDNDVHGHTLAAEVGRYPDKILHNGLDTTGYVFPAAEFEDHRSYLDDVCSRFRVHAERGRKWIPRFYDGDDFLELLAWYITEGSVSTSEEKQFGENLRGSATTVQIAQDAQVTDDGPLAADGGDHADIGAVLDRMGFDYYVDGKGYQFTSKLLGDFLERTCGANSFEKQIPEFVFEASQAQKRRFLDALVAGDGDRQKNSWRYSTASERLRDDVLRLCAHVGLTANFTQDSGTWRIDVSEGSKNTLRMYRSSARSTADDGVYCVTVADNHTLLAGRNGTFQFVGQSLYGVSGWERFRLYDKENAAAVTATGRAVIDYTQKIAEKELGYKIAYGDTDSIMIELGPDFSKEDAIETSFDIQEHINAAYDEFALEKLGAEFHRFQIEFEKLYRRFFQAGKKKRYAGHIVWKEGKDVDDVDVTGFEYKRSDIASITKRVQLEVIERIVHGEDLDSVKEYLHEVVTDFQAGNVPLEDVGIPGGIGKRLDAYETDTAQVRGAKYANLLLGTNFGRGSKPKRLYLERVTPAFFDRFEDEHPELFPPEGRSGLSGDRRRQRELYDEFRAEQDVICFEYDDQLPAEFVVDYEKMLDRTLKGPISRIIEALDMSWDEVVSGQEQTGLGKFM